MVIYHHQGNGELLQVPFGEFRNLDILAVLADFPIHARRVLKHPQPSRVVIFIRKLDTRSLWTMYWPGTLSKPPPDMIIKSLIFSGFSIVLDPRSGQLLLL